MCTNNNKAVINSNYRRVQDLVLCFRLAIGTREDFIEICGQYGHASSKNVSPALFEYDVKDFY